MIVSPPEDHASGFDLLFDLCTHIAQGRVSTSMVYLLGASRLLALEKPSGVVRPVAVVLWGRYFIDLLHVDIQNAFNTISREALFHELRATTSSLDQLFPFVHSFYACRSPLYFSHRSHEDEVSLLSSESGTHQGDPLGGALFALAHLRALRTTASEHPLCLFPSLADDTHIVGPLEAIMPPFHTLEGHLSVVDLTVQPIKCAAWSPSGVPSSLSLLPPWFFTPFCRASSTWRPYRIRFLPGIICERCLRGRCLYRSSATIVGGFSDSFWFVIALLCAAS
ncbi:hypothetical protein R1flu_006309 [Riccia fluitans]|uniref:Reverse transcriptase domain-containing protein n=1 Tax=Riccia fluitans TaxID=41844 RepID=A0ABD1YVY8_9MARC